MTKYDLSLNVIILSAAAVLMYWQSDSTKDLVWSAVTLGIVIMIQLCFWFAWWTAVEGFKPRSQGEREWIKRMNREIFEPRRRSQGKR